MIIVNKARCLYCKDVIESKHRHDFVSCSCGAISVDGGTAYLRRLAANWGDFEDLSETQKLMFIKGNIFSSNARALVNPVNCVGTMGKGLALEFAKRYPDNFVKYKKACESGEIKIGYPLITSEGYFKNIVNFPTKDHWQRPSKLSYIKEGLDRLIDQLADLKLPNPTIAFPKLGCGLGGLRWEDVKPLIQRFSDQYEGDTYVYEGS